MNFCGRTLAQKGVNQVLYRVRLGDDAAFAVEVVALLPPVLRRAGRFVCSASTSDIVRLLWE